MIEELQTKTDRNPIWGWAIVGWVVWGIVLIAGCLLAKSYLIHAQYMSGMGTPTSTLPGLIFVGLAMAAPFQSAFLLSLLPGSLFRRIAAASLWMVLVIVATKIGNSAYPEVASPMVFSPVLTSMFPLIVLGFCVPLGSLRHWRVWQLEFGENLIPCAQQKLTISSLIGLTAIVAMAFSALQLGPEVSYQTLSIGICVGVAVGTVSIALILANMKLRRSLTLPVYIAIVVGTFYLTLRLMLSIGAGAQSPLNAIVYSSFVCALLGGGL